ncbi:MAG: hypothetical protein M1817_006849 [Caeruleum heppii]|nr:MAG: hypothetical protein M1817_006849 [Caeruleum heppii]
MNNAWVIVHRAARSSSTVSPPSWRHRAASFLSCLDQRPSSLYNHTSKRSLSSIVPPSHNLLSSERSPQISIVSRAIRHRIPWAASSPRRCYATSKRPPPRSRPPPHTPPASRTPASPPPVSRPPPLPTLPEDYTDEIGLPFRSQPLTPSELLTISGRSVSPPLDEADNILQVLHGRRIAGTLDDPEIDQDIPSATPYGHHFVENGLNWLRHHYPLDEDAALVRRVEKEEAELEEKLTREAERLGLYKPQMGAQADRRLGSSGLEEIQKVYEQERKVEERRNMQVADVKETTGGAVEGVKARVDLRRRETPAWVKYYQDRAMITKDTTPPDLSTIRRLLPSVLVTLLVLSFSYLYATYYIPPHRMARLFPDTPPAAATILGITALNAAVLIAWRIPPAWRFLNRYFLSIPGYPYALGVVGNVFSHQGFGHFAVNMGVLWVVGTQRSFSSSRVEGLRLIRDIKPTVHDSLTRGPFLALYLSSGVLGSLLSLTSHVLRRNFITSSLGASGAIAGIIAAWCVVNQEYTIFLSPSLPPPFPD